MLGRTIKGSETDASWGKRGGVQHWGWCTYPQRKSVWVSFHSSLPPCLHSTLSHLSLSLSSPLEGLLERMKTMIIPQVLCPWLNSILKRKEQSRLPVRSMSIKISKECKPKSKDKMDKNPNQPPFFSQWVRFGCWWWICPRPQSDETKGWSCRKLTRLR